MNSHFKIIEGFSNLLNQVFLKGFFLIIVIFLFNSTSCFIKIPFKYFPEKTFNKKEKYCFINNLINQKIYGLIEIGSPKQFIYLPINFFSNDFYITPKALYKSMLFYDDPYVYHTIDKLYDDNRSDTLITIYNEDFYEGVNFEMASYKKDIFYFGGEKIGLEFYLASSLDYPSEGEIGLQLLPSSIHNTASPSIEKTFFKKLKNKGLINNYAWSIFYNGSINSEGEEGILVLGEYPHNIPKSNLSFNKYSNYNSLYLIDCYIEQKTVFTKFIFDEISVYSNKKGIKINEISFKEQELNSILDYNFGGIRGTENVRLYLEKNILNEKNLCYKDYINYKTKCIFYYCKNDKSIKNKIKESFPIFHFKSKKLNSDFTIKYEDLFIDENNFIYCLMIFSDSIINDWSLGKPFLKKYQFVIDFEAKKLGFYKYNEEDKNKKSQNKYSVFLKLIIINLLIILLLLGFFAGIKAYRNSIKKYRSNEIEENFDYVPHKK